MPQDLDAALAAMRERYASAAANTVAAFERISKQLETAPAAHALLTALRRELHRVHGTAGSVGFAEASRLAASMETLATRWLDDPSLDADRRGAVIAQFARSLRESLAAPAANDRASAVERSRLLLAGLPDGLASGLIAEGMARGARVERVAREALAQAIAQGAVAGIVTVDVPVPAGVADGVPRVVLLTPDAEDEYFAPEAGQRVLHAGAEPKAILDALAVLGQVSGPHGGTAVVVDDEPVVRTLISSLLERDGMRVVARSSARGFMAAMRDANPLLLVLDVDLPRSSGITLSKRIRAAPGMEDLLILMLTGHADPATRAAAFAAGADDYMLKPIVPKEFQQRVARLLETRRQRRATGGLHETTGMSLRARTMREIESLLRRWGDSPSSVCVVRPAVLPHGADDEAAWHNESARVARAVRAADGFAGMLDAAAVGGAVPLPPLDALAMLAALLGDAPDAAPAWHAGVATSAGNVENTPRALIDAADAAGLAARESGVPGRLWNPDDFDIAPDVIVVEDDDALAEMEEFALESHGLSHRRFSTGPAALEALVRMRAHGRRPIVLLDVDLPGLDGHSLHERLRVDRPNVFDVVFVSVHSSEGDQLRALQSGALDYITKPVRMRVLMAKIDSWRARAASA